MRDLALNFWKADSVTFLEEDLVTMRKAIWTSLLIVILALPALAGASDREEFTHSYDISANGRVEVGNVNGYITVQGWKESRVDLVAVKRGDKSDFDLVEIEIENTSDSLSVKTRYPRHSNHVDVSVDYELKVPFGTEGKYSTVNGRVDVDGVAGRLDTSAVNGSVEVRGLRSSIDADTVNGKIRIQVAELTSGSRISLKTVNGSMDLALPDNANANLSVKSLNGGISTDFPVTVRGTFGTRKLEGQIGNGGATIDISSVNGGIEIRKNSL